MLKIINYPFDVNGSLLKLNQNQYFMKTSTILLSLFVINSSFLASYFSTELITSLNPFILGITEVCLGLLYYINRVIRDVRNTFDVDFTF